jgi:uncharacterized membrane protein
MGHLLGYGILVLGLAMICPTFWLIFGVTLVALIIVVKRILGAFKKPARVTAKEG